MRFFTNSDIEIPVRWFFCSDGAQLFPGRHNFGSGNWDSVWAVPGLGEQLGARPWRDGSPPPFNAAPAAPGFDGKKFSGPLEVFQDGDELPTPTPADFIGQQSDGLCWTCAKIVGPTCIYSDQVPDTIFVQVYAVTYRPGPPNAKPGDVFTMTRLQPGSNVWVIDRVLHDQCGGDFAIVELDCSNNGWQGHGLYTSLQAPTEASFPPLSLRFRDFQLFDGLTVCGDPSRFESWDCRIFSEPPPP